MPNSHCSARHGKLLVNRRQLICTTASLAFLQSSVLAANPVVVVRPAPESRGDIRYDHYWKLLEQALATTEAEFGPYDLQVATTAMNEARSLHELEIGSHQITILVHGNVADYERRLLPIRFPLDKGLLGYRVFLIRSEEQSALDAVNS